MRMIYDRVLRLRLISFGKKEKWQEFKVARMDARSMLSFQSTASSDRCCLIIDVRLYFSKSIFHLRNRDFITRRHRLDIKLFILRV